MGFKNCRSAYLSNGDSNKFITMYLLGLSGGLFKGLAVSNCNSRVHLVGSYKGNQSLTALFRGERGAMTKLTGEQRIKLVVHWIKLGGKEYMDKETYIRKVCKAKGLEYTPPVEVSR